MPTFDTPEPITVMIELGVGSVHIAASDRTDTVVDLHPTNESDRSDVNAAKNTRVDYNEGCLVVKVPKQHVLDFTSRTKSVDVSISVPTGSRVQGTAAVADLHCTGQLGECRYKASNGHIHLETAGPVHLDTTAGNIRVDHVAGRADVTSGTGWVNIGTIDGPAVVKTSNGDAEIGTVSDEAVLRAANGSISVNRALGDRVEARTANGSVRIGETVRGSVVMRTSSGNLEVGIAEGTAALLDVNTGYGRLNTLLDSSASGPGDAAETVEVRAQTQFGDITIRRA
ncbi:DUF4097 family beta strand repeat-containing protein [Amycolatopsis sp. VS8301801F10]|uniref:DUF4097 family beta strand repeat-containing protein n=1 Tax=Amycolatopsis sp. VS8301801F10 TaxID=2652442 RepID=UPI0038FC7F10